MVRTAVTNHCTDEIAVIVVPDYAAANQTGPVSSAGRARPMAKRTGLRELGAAPLHRIGRKLRPILGPNAHYAPYREEHTDSSH